MNAQSSDYTQAMSWWEHAYRDGMKRVTVEGVLEKVETAVRQYPPASSGH